METHPNKDRSTDDVGRFLTFIRFEKSKLIVVAILYVYEVIVGSRNPFLGD